MRNFVKLTDEDGRSVLLNPLHIIYVGQIPTTRRTLIQLVERTSMVAVEDFDTVAGRVNYAVGKDFSA